MAFVQEQHRLSITTPLGKDVLLLRGFNGSEAISRLFHFDLDLLSENDSIHFEDVVGRNVTLKIDDANGVERHWNGFISRFSQGARDGRLTAYYAQMVPWPWFLTRTADCRIFQGQKVPDIIQKIFNDLKFHDFELRLYGTYLPRDYCVQYRETDFNFVSRLMEEEGICYFFDHKDGKHILVLADDAAAHKACQTQKTARCGFQSRGTTYKEDLVTEWHYHEEFRTGAWAQTDYNFETPSTSLAVTLSGKNLYEIYDYPGEHRVRAEGDRLARIRLQEQSAPARVSQGASTCRGFGSGFQFSLQDHYRKDLNQAYLLTSVRHTATEGGAYGVGTGTGEELAYSNSFECIPFSTAYRPARVTPQPFVQGCQTAVVVGPAGEEIYTDKHGRVKVQFHWDREGKKNENSSCWIRVSHPMAGQGWGSVSIPRIGQEVIVDFLEGDPDQPIIIGRVYNAEQMPPFGMPGGAMVSGFKSNSTKGGGGYNEISLNDTKGKELINIHAQYDHEKKVEHDERATIVNDRSRSIGRNETIDIGNNRTKTVKVDETVSIGGNRKKDIKGNETTTIKGDRKEDVTGTETIGITGDRTETVKGGETHSIKGDRNHTVSSSETVTVKLTRTHHVFINDMLNVGAAQEVNVIGAQAVTVGAARNKTVVGAETCSMGSQTITVRGAVTETTGADHNQTVKGSRGANITGDDVIHCKTMTITAKEKITFTTGDATICMESNGKISITGKDMTFDGKDIALTGSGKITSKASGDVVLKGKNVLHN